MVAHQVEPELCMVGDHRRLRLQPGINHHDIHLAVPDVDIAPAFGQADNALTA